MSGGTTQQRTAEIRDALRYADRFISDHGLHAARVEINASSSGWRWNKATGEIDLPVLPAIHVLVAHDWQRRDSTGFAAWCRAIGAETVRIERRELDTCLWAHADLDGHTWRLIDSVERPDTGPCLPAAQVEWERSDSGRRKRQGHVTVEDLEIALRSLVREGDER